LKLSLQFRVGGSNIDTWCVFVMEEFSNSSSIFTLCAWGVAEREGGALFHIHLQFVCKLHF
jgi:hypothetical protein